MANKIRLRDFITLGQHIAIVANPQPWHVDVLANEMASMIEQMKACKMKRAADAADPLGTKQLIFDRRTNKITEPTVADIQRTMQSVINLLYADADEREILILDSSAVSPRLKEVAKAEWLTNIQQLLAEETIRCLESGAYRAAVVMGWCFAYDTIRHWVCRDQSRLTAFNMELATYTKHKSTMRVYEDIVAYEDFFKPKSPGETVVIAICEGAKLFGGKMARKLIHHLDMRNDYAHATTFHPTATQANAYIEHLLDILMNPPFSVGAVLAAQTQPA